MKKLFISLSFVFILIFAGCKETPTQPLDTSVIWPLNVGNYWEYKCSKFDLSGNITVIEYDTMTVVLDTLINNLNVYKIKSIDYDYYFYNLSDGLYQFRLRKIEPDTTYIMFKYPGNVGDRFVPGDTIYIISTNENITISAGTFNCYRYENSSNHYNKSVYYCSPNIGIIKFEVYDRDTKDNFILRKKTELFSYKLY